MKAMPLRYSISNWGQATQCISNNSTKLHIKVSYFNNGQNFKGTRLAVEHEMYGVLFSTVINGEGEIITSIEPEDLTTAQILLQLEKYGFLIEYSVNNQMTSEQIAYLITVNDLHFDKIRVLPTVEYNMIGQQEIKYHVVVFQSDKLPRWLNVNIGVSKKEFLESLDTGFALNLDGISETKHFDWDWLNFVGTISDIIQDYEYAKEETGDGE